MRFYFYLLLFFFVSLSTSLVVAQNTFIHRYKNTPIAETGVAVCELPNNRIAIVGQQANGLAWQAPMIVVTDSLGNQIRHFVDTACNACDPFDAAADSKGFIYVAGNAYGKAGLIKYDTLGNRIWLKQFYPYGIESGFQCISIVSDSLIIAGGAEATDGFGGKAVLVGFNNIGDTLWSIYLEYSTTTSILDISYDSIYIYATGVVSDTIPPLQSPFYLRVNKDGQNPIYKKLDNGRKYGYGVISVTPDSILIGGRADNTGGWGTYSFVSLIDSTGNVLQNVGDSNYLFTQILKMDFAPNTQTLYTLSYDTIDVIGTSSPQSRLSAYNYPVTNLQQPVWANTVTGTIMAGFADLKLATDGTILHTSMATTNCPNCPYLLKADANTCADFSCDTAFVSSISIENLFNASLKLYPNPVTSGYLFYELKSDEYLQTVEILCYDINGRYHPLNNSETLSNGELYKGRLTVGDNLASGIYIVKFVVNNKYNLYGRFIKTD